MLRRPITREEGVAVWDGAARHSSCAGSPGERAGEVLQACGRGRCAQAPPARDGAGTAGDGVRRRGAARRAHRRRPCT